MSISLSEIGPTASIEPISAAMNLFWQRGYVATSLSDLLSRMKVSRKRIYSTYGSKEALFQAALRTYVRDEAAPRMACLLGEAKGLGAIESYLKSWQFGPGFRGCLLWNSAAEAENLTPEAMRIVQEYFDRLRGAVLENLEASKLRGELKHLGEIPSLALQVISTALGLSLMGKLVSSTAASENTVSQLMASLRGAPCQSQSAAAC